METSALSSDSPSTNSSSSVAAGRDSGTNWECGGDSVVWSELEAAEALAGLADSAIPGSGTWSLNEEGRPSQQLKTDSPAEVLGANHEDSVLRSSDPSEDQPVAVQQQCENICSLVIKRVKVEQDAELPKPSTMCTTSYASSSGSKSRKKLTEAEKEGRRIRRVLANRESARQTIRRRQTVYEELIRKVANLAQENENLKRGKELAVKEYDSLKSTNDCLKEQGKELAVKEYNSLKSTNECLKEQGKELAVKEYDSLKSTNDCSKEQGKELAVKEYDSLKSTNDCLKEQMAKTIDTDIEETQVDSKSTNPEIPTSPYANCPFFIYNQTPFTPFPWPTIIQLSNPVQLHNASRNSIVVPLEIPMSSIAKPDPFHEQENPLKANGPATPLYILPSPWVFPLLDHGNGLHLRPSFVLNEEQNGTSMNNQHIPRSSSKKFAHEENRQLLLPIEVQTEASSSTEVIPANNLHETLFRFPPDGGGLYTGHHPKEAVVFPAGSKSVRTVSVVKHESGQQSHHSPNVQPLSSTVGYTLTALSEMKRDTIVSTSKKEVDAGAAGEARRKRKELTILKRLHCR